MHSFRPSIAPLAAGAYRGAPGIAALLALVTWTIAFSVTSAEAACTPTTAPFTPLNNTVVTCTGATNEQNPTNDSGYGTSHENGLTINVGTASQPNASVLGSAIGINVLENNTVVNFGTISGALQGIAADNNLTVLNSGIISSSQSSVLANNGLALTNSAHGLILGEVSANSGTISNLGVMGPIAFDETGGAIASSIFNSGTITNVGSGLNFAIFFDGAVGNKLILDTTSNIVGLVHGAGSDILQLGGSSGSGTFNLSNLGSGHQYTGFSTFNKIDNSTWTLTGTDSGNNAWTVQGGTLLVDGVTGGAMTVQSGAFLGGIGSVGATSIASGGTLTPGHGGIGTLTINGNLSFASGGAYQIAVNGANAGLTVVNGTATLNNALAFISFANSGTFSSQYTILSATSLSGTFSKPFTNSSAITANLNYTANDVILNLASNIGGTSSGGSGNSGGSGGNGGVVGLTRNQQAVATGLNNALNIGGQSLTGLIGLSNSQIPAALDALSGEGVSASQQGAFAAGDMFLSMMMDQGAFWRTGVNGTANGGSYGAPLGYAGETTAPAPFNTNAYNVNASANPGAMPVKAASFEPRWRSWVGGFDSTSLLRGQADPGSADQRDRLAGAVGGVEYLFNPDLLAGIALGGSSSSFSVADRSTSGSLRGAHLGGYTVARFSPLYVAGALQYSHFDDNSSRTIAGVGPAETATGNFGSDLFSGRVEVGWQYALMPGLAVTPFAAVQVAELWQRGFNEVAFGPNGSVGADALGFASQRVTSLPTFIGAEFDARYAFANGMILTSFSRLSWVHEFDPVRSVTASFLALADSTFTVEGPRATSDAARIDLGAQLAINPRTALFANFNGEFSDRSQSYAGKGGVRFNW